MIFGGNKIQSAGSKKVASPYLSYGVKCVKITDIAINKSKSGEAMQVLISVEGPVIKDPDFKGLDGARGQKGIIKTFYMSKDEHYKAFQGQLKLIAEKMGKVNEFNDFPETDSFEEYIRGMKRILSNEFVWLLVSAEEYEKADGRKGYTLGLPRKYFAASIDEVDENTLVYDKGVPVSVSGKDGANKLNFSWEFNFRVANKPDSSFTGKSASEAAQSLSKQPDPILPDNPIPPREVSTDDLPF